MLGKITSEQFAEWIAYFRCEPFGEKWMQTSFICSTINNIVATKASEQIDLDYFLPDFAREKKKTKIDTVTDEMEMAMRFSK